MRGLGFFSKQSGSGVYPTVVITGTTRTATNYATFASALALSTSGDGIFIPGDSEINVTNVEVVIPAGVTIYGERGKPKEGGGNWLGGRFYTTSSTFSHVFYTGGADVTVKLLRFEGYDATVGAGTAPYLRGFNVRHNNFRIEWCEISNFQTAGIDVDYTTWSFTYRTYITRCYIHHCQQAGYGYGIQTGDGYSVITYCKFHSCRHAIAGNGASTCSNEVAFNLFAAPNAITSGSHTVDMHSITGDEVPGDGGNVLNYHDNIFETRDPADGRVHLMLRGYPVTHAYIQNNKFAYSTLAASLSIIGSPTNVSNATHTISGNILSYLGPYPNYSDINLYWTLG